MARKVPEDDEDDEEEEEEEGESGEPAESEDEEEDGKDGEAGLAGLGERKASSQSLAFSAFRSLGMVTTDTPSVVARRGQKSFVTTAVGRSFHIYDCSKMRLQFVGPTLPRKVRALASTNKYTFAAAAENIHVTERGKEVGVLTGHSGRVLQMLPFGGNFLLSIAEDSGEGKLRVWDTNQLTEHACITFPEGFTPSVMSHPATYLNKILVGSKQGGVALWNIRTCKLIHEFKNTKNDPNDPVTCMEASPAVDTMVVGFGSGLITMLNVRFDEAVFTLFQEGGAVTAASFRTDGQAKMVTTSASGRLSVWDLDSRSLVVAISHAHAAAVTTAVFLAAEPALITSGADNTLKMWVFDQPDGSPRVLRHRSGHRRPPTRVQYYRDHKTLLSSGLDRALRLTSTIQDHQNVEISQGSVVAKARQLNLSEEDLKLPPVVAMAACQVRERDWYNVITCHEGQHIARTWKSEQKGMGPHKLASTAGERGAIKSVAISACGSFGFIGAVTGHVDVYNMQSGFLRGSFMDASLQERAHTATVSGIACDGLNETVLTVSLDGTLKVWDFTARKLLRTVQVGSPVTQCVIHRESELLATAADDFVVRVFDIATHNVVRRFGGHGNKITDVAFSPDARWLVTSSMDATVRLFDLPTSRLVDWFAVERPVTSLSFSPTGDFLATVHAGKLGIYLWANRALYSAVAMESIEAPLMASMPAAIAEEDSSGSAEAEAPLAPGLVTFSNAPKTKWQNLAVLDVIKARNKAREAEKEKVEAPFFLPMLPGLDPKFAAPEEVETRERAMSEDITDGAEGWELGNVWHDDDDDAVSGEEQEGSEEEGDDDEEEEAMPKKRGKRARGGTATKAAPGFNKAMADTRFRELLWAGGKAGDYTAAMAHLQGMGPAAVDIELRTMPGVALGALFDMYQAQLDSRRSFELVEAYLDLTLQIHTAAIAEDEVLVRKAQAVAQAHRKVWEKLEDAMQYNLCLLGHFTRMQ